LRQVTIPFLPFGIYLLTFVFTTIWNPDNLPKQLLSWFSNHFANANAFSECCLIWLITFPLQTWIILNGLWTDCSSKIRNPSKISLASSNAAAPKASLIY
jgi:hypothetical protein